VKIGSLVNIGKDCHFGVSCPDGLHDGPPVLIIEDNCHIVRDVILSASVLVMDHNHGFEDVTLPIRDQGITPGGKIRIGQGCWIGHGAAIVCGSGELVLGRNCVVGANAVITKSFPPYSIIVGSPAKVLRQYDPVKQSWQSEFGQPRVQAEKE
jgi:acetyltransferase-like isoleucine patch superfamily enzyme